MEKLNQWLTLAANLGVLAGIVFLAYEIQVNTDAVRSSNYASYNEVANSWADFGADHAATLVRVQQSTDIGEFSAEELLIYGMWGTKSLSQIESIYLHHRAGSLDDDVFEARMAAFVDFMLNNPVLLDRWRNGPRSAEVPDFIELAEKRIQLAKATMLPKRTQTDSADAPGR